ncbi:MAG: metallophosphoesterase [Candidatus Aerophobetes bacterium]|nr:metallophosphoesterase [Candidatus Aerophobetes bacterium]
MRIGIMADSHDNLPMIEKAVNFFNQKKVKLVLHAGDFIAPFVVMRKLKNLSSPLIGVFGNNDGEKEGLIKEIAKIGEIHSPPFKLKYGGRKIVLSHTSLDMKKIEESKSDLIVYGHTHQPEVKREKGTLLVNPGECGGWLSGCATVALVDLDNMKAGIITLS